MDINKSFTFGYDFESIIIDNKLTLDRKKYKKSFEIMKKIVKIHKNKKIRFTIFVLGKMAEIPEINSFLSLLNKSNEYADIQQHSYSHMIFKENTNKGIAESINTMDNEISKTNDIIEKIIGEKPIGLRIPIGFYRGYQGQIKRLEILRKNGIRFVSSDLRGPNDKFPAPWKDSLNYYRQPYFYKEESFPEILEIPTQGDIDVHLKGISKIPNRKPLTLKEELTYYINNINFISRNNLNYSTIFHPWSIAYNDEELFILNKLIEYLLKNKIPILSYKDLYEIKIL